MKALFSFLFLLLAAAVQALSATGSRLLVILDDVADKSEYSTFLGDLTSMFLRPGRNWACGSRNHAKV